MLLKRYHIRLGAKTTAGGIVKTASTRHFLNGSPLAVERDLIDCPACGSEGVIEVVPPRLRDTYNGKEFALSDDLCICKCSPPPKLVADQHMRYQMMAVASVESAKEAEARAVSANTEELLPMRLAEATTGRAHANCSYRLELRDKVIEGVTDADGLTRPLSKSEREALVAWNVTPGAA